MDPNLPIEALPGVGPAIAQKLKKLNILTLQDLIYYFPFRYDDFSNISKIGELPPEQKITIQGVIWQIKNVRTRTGKFITQAQVADESGVVDVVWFNQSYLTKTLKAGMPVSLSGKAQVEGHKVKLISPQYEILKNLLSTHLSTNQNTTHTGRLVPIYPETQSLSSKWLRAKIKEVLPIYLKTNPDFMPESVIKNQNLQKLETALFKIHFPTNYQQVELARNRLGFDELFTTQLLSQIRKRTWHQNQTAPKLEMEKEKIASFTSSLPFQLTDAQKRSMDELAADLAKSTPTNRLLEGDVGSGKTAVAALGAYMAAICGFDSLIAVPTEILAFQHFDSLKKMMAPFNISVGIWTASKKEPGQITTGTHALLSSFKAKNPIGFVTVDEQHRFGVAQRAGLILNQSPKLTPHLLTMTATPIPRTLALTLYGDLDLSVLDQMPKGRQKISTFVVPNNKRADCYTFIQKQIKDDRQAFIITPFVEPSESMTSVKSATVEFEKAKNKFPAQIKLGLLHGRLKSKDKEKIITQFKLGKIDILVATPVVEVGIDVANASVILVESSERFGLAQLHQLRGRVGRGVHKSYCFLFTDSNQENSTRRLKSMEKVHVGFELAEIDLKMRGSGEIFGLKQSGFENFKIADLTDQKLIVQAQKEARKLLADDPELVNSELLKIKIKSLENQYSQPN